MKLYISILTFLLFSYNFIINNIKKEKVKQNTLTYQEYGEGEEVVFLLSPIYSTKDVFLENIAINLSQKGFHVYLIHYNMKHVKMKGITDFFPSYITAIDDFRKYLDIDRITIIGHDISGTLALKYSIDFKENTNQLVLISHGAYDYSFYGVTYNQKIYRRFSENDAELKANLYNQKFANKIHSRELFTTIDSLSTYYLTYNQEEYSQIWKGLQNSERDIYWENFLYTSFYANEYDFKSELEQLKIKTLIVQGEHDFLTNETANEMHSLLPNSKQITISNSGHYPWYENEEEFYEKLFKELDVK